MNQEIFESLRNRLDSLPSKSRVQWLKKAMRNSNNTFEEEVAEIYSLVIGKVVMAVTTGSAFLNTTVAIGELLREYYGAQPVEEESKLAAHTGAKILEAFCNKDIEDSPVKLFDIERVKQTSTRKSKQHPFYAIKCIDNELLIELTNSEEFRNGPEFPLLEPPGEWKGSYHPVLRTTLIKGGPQWAQKQLSPDSNGLVFNALNKLQTTGYKINQQVFEVYQHYMSQQDKSVLYRKDYQVNEGSPFKHEKEQILASRVGKYLEAKFIESLAESLGEQTFYQGYNCDFRGRIYTLTPYLNEQSSDNAKGMLLYEEEVPLGEDGAYWLGIHTANSIGEDKLPLDDRAKYTEDHMEEIISWAEDPYNNTGWMKADKSWSTLACAFEWKRIHEFVNVWKQPIEAYICKLPIFIDGTNNGVQHLTALSLDEKIAPLVNLVPTEIPGDVYMYVADKTWEELDRLYNELVIDNPDIDETLATAKAEVKDFLVRQDQARNNMEWRKINDAFKAYNNANKKMHALLYIPFWHAIQDKKVQRKTVKRPVMTLGYGVTDSGIREQVYLDTTDLSDDLKFKHYTWSSKFADLLNTTMRSNLKGPATMLALFRSLADKANNKGEYLGWMVPFTNFPVRQEYLEYKEDEVRIRFCGMGSGGGGIQLSLSPKETGTLNKGGQSNGAAPNIVHSFDAAHLTMIVNASPFTVTTVHDSFGSHPGNMGELFRITREQFLKFYESDPLMILLAQLDAVHLRPDRGTLNLADILESDFAFS